MIETDLVTRHNIEIDSVATQLNIETDLVAIIYRNTLGGYALISIETDFVATYNLT